MCFGGMKGHRPHSIVAPSLLHVYNRLIYTFGVGFFVRRVVFGSS